ncbi:hypothetical protein ACFLRC_01455 [Candidatus Altiarchaeota archaeon]
MEGSFQNDIRNFLKAKYRRLYTGREIWDTAIHWSPILFKKKGKLIAAEPIILSDPILDYLYLEIKKTIKKQIVDEIWFILPSEIIPDFIDSNKKKIEGKPIKIYTYLEGKLFEFDTSEKEIPYEKNISPELLRRLSKTQLKKVKYKSTIHEFRTEYQNGFFRTISEERQFVLTYVKKLLIEENVPDTVVELIEDFSQSEPLFQRRSEYRDHFIHIFQVFLLGVVIIENRYSDFINLRKNIEKEWLLVSLLHDLGYIISEHENVTRRYCALFGYSTLQESTILNNKSMKDLIRIIKHYFEIITGNKIRSNNPRYKELLLKIKNKASSEHGTVVHSIPSATSFITNIENSGVLASQEDLDFLALSILFHDGSIYELIGPLKIEQFPLSVLLIFCDTIQDWGRDSAFGHPIEYAKLNAITINDKIQCDIEIRTTSKGINYKENEIKKMRKILKFSSQIKLHVKITATTTF